MSGRDFFELACDEALQGLNLQLSLLMCVSYANEGNVML